LYKTSNLKKIANNYTVLIISQCVINASFLLAGALDITFCTHNLKLQRVTNHSLDNLIPIKNVILPSSKSSSSHQYLKPNNTLHISPNHHSRHPCIRFPLSSVIERSVKEWLLLPASCTTMHLLLLPGHIHNVLWLVLSPPN